MPEGIELSVLYQDLNTLSTEIVGIGKTRKNIK